MVIQMNSINEKVNAQFLSNEQFGPSKQYRLKGSLPHQVLEHTGMLFISLPVKESRRNIPFGIWLFHLGKL
jgi:hypothetical protein